MYSLLAPSHPVRTAPAIVAPTLARAAASLGISDDNAPTLAQQRTAYRGLIAMASRIRSNRVGKALARARAQREVEQDRFEPVEQAHPWARLLRQPHPSLSARSLWSWVQQAKDLGRGAFLVIERDGAGRPLYLHPVFPSFGEVKPVGSASGSVESYVFHRADGQRQTWEARDVVWIRHPHPVSPFESASLLELTAYESDTDLYARIYLRDLLRRGGAPKLQITSEQPVDGKSALELSARLSPAVLNQNASQLIPVFGKGARVETIGLSAKDMEFVQAAGLTRTDLLQTWGIPEGLFSDRANRANADAAQYILADLTLQPETDDACDQLTTQLRAAFEPAGQPSSAAILALTVVPPNVVPLDPDLALKTDESHLRTGLRSIDELRERDGVEAWGGDAARPMISAAVIPIAAPVADAGGGEEAAIPEQALNGAQVQAAVEIVAQVALGALPRPTGVQMLMTFFNLSTDAAEAVMGTVGNGFVPVAPAEAAPPATSADPAADRSRAILRMLGRLRVAGVMTRTDFDSEWRAVDALKVKAERPVEAAALAYLCKMGAAVATQIAESRSLRKESKTPASLLSFDVATWIEALDVDLGPTFARALQAGFFSGLDRLDIELEFDASRPSVRRALARVMEKATSIPKTMRDAAEGAVRDGLAADEDVDAIAARVRALFDDMAPWKARQIAQTSGTQAFEAGQLESYSRAGVSKKGWLSQRDGKVRPEHDAVDGEVVGVDEAFSNGSQHPEDPGCRCTTYPVLDDRSAPASSAPSDAWVQRRNEHIQAAYRAAIKGR
ncbi:MAG TPA: phage portal protein, partial [Rubricoccaceae bacterium]